MNNKYFVKSEFKKQLVLDQVLPRINIFLFLYRIRSSENSYQSAWKPSKSQSNSFRKISFWKLKNESLKLFKSKVKFNLWFSLQNYSWAKWNNKWWSFCIWRQQIQFQSIYFLSSDVEFTNPCHGPWKPVSKIYYFFVIAVEKFKKNHYLFSLCSLYPEYINP